MAAATAKNLEQIRTEIARACRDARRDPADVTLIAVSKTFAADAIEPAIGAGQRVFGENRVQEASKDGHFACETSGYAIASHRSAPVEQGERSDRAFRRNSFRRSGKSLRSSVER